MTRLLAGIEFAALLATPALAQDARSQADRIAALEAQIAALAKEIAELKAQSSADRPPAPAKKPEAIASLAKGRPTLESGDGQFTIELRGFFQLDAARYDQASPGPLASDFRRGSFGGGAENDRARDLAAAKLGYVTLRPAYEHTMHEPALVADAIAGVLARYRLRPVQNSGDRHGLNDHMR